MDQNTKIIELRNISKSFNGEQVLKGIDLDIHDKEFITLLGPSGCGKTTTLRIIGGFVTPDTGDVCFLGKKINDLPPYKRKVNTVFQNIYSFFVGNRVGLASLGYYTQGDKWSKMGVTSISQVLTSSFLPVLSAVQDDPGRFRRLCSKMNRFTAYLVFPALIGLIVIAEPVFHLLFGTKWDPSIILFQLLLVRGIFFVLTSLYNNFLLALGRSGIIVRLEILRDTVAIAALVASLPFIAQSTPDNPVYGLTLMLWGQVAASAISWGATLYVTARTVGSRVASFLFDLVPYAVMTVAIIPLMLWIMSLTATPLAMILAGAAVAVAFYLGINAILGSKIQNEVLGYLHFSKKINS